MAVDAGAPPPSIRGRLWRSLLGLSLCWGLAVSLVAWVAVRGEVDELLDDTLLQASAVLNDVIEASGDLLAARSITVVPDPSQDDDRFAWQVCGPGPRVLLRSALAPPAPWLPALPVGYADAGDWRVYGVRLSDGQRLLYVAQSRRERREALLEVSLSAVAASLLAGLVTVVWLRARVDRELRPLAALSQALALYDPLDGHALGPPRREELVPIQRAIDDLGSRLARRVASERAFAAHAAHALRTPLAGIDAQLAVALRECDPALRPRLANTRTAASRLARVVAALLALFRTGADVQRAPLDLATLRARTPFDGLAVGIDARSLAATVDADADLLAAVLLNLFDNSQRHGATRVTLALAGCTLTVADDGRGVGDERRAALQAALDGGHDAAPLGLGLRLAELVARAHGGGLALPPAAQGFVVALRLGPG